MSDEDREDFLYELRVMNANLQALHERLGYLNELEDIKFALGVLATIGFGAVVFTAFMIFFGGWG